MGDAPQRVRREGRNKSKTGNGIYDRRPDSSHPARALSRQCFIRCGPPLVVPVEGTPWRAMRQRAAGAADG